MFCVSVCLCLCTETVKKKKKSTYKVWLVGIVVSEPSLCNHPLASWRTRVPVGNHQCTEERTLRQIWV